MLVILIYLPIFIVVVSALHEVVAGMEESRQTGWRKSGEVWYGGLHYTQSIMSTG